MNIHHAVVAPIAAFVYCNRYAPPAVNFAHDDANTFDRQLNSADGRVQLKLFYFIS